MAIRIQWIIMTTYDFPTTALPFCSTSSYFSGQQKVTMTKHFEKTLKSLRDAHVKIHPLTLLSPSGFASSVDLFLKIPPSGILDDRSHHTNVPLDYTLCFIHSLSRGFLT